jgi:hypothetical protein
MSFVNKLYSAPEVSDRQLGLMASELVKHPAFQISTQQLLRSIVDTWLGSAPNDAAKRESLYLQAYALLQLEAQLNGLAAQKESNDDGQSE